MPRHLYQVISCFGNFCDERGYLWAWSDTCCIDKTNSAELQEAIGSMFGWYRRSRLMIVYLADVTESGPFDSSHWFGHGWTLQESLAPGTMLFYTRNWSLYKNIESSNHKTDDAILEELTKATGIASRFLADFTPGCWRLNHPCVILIFGALFG
ncbi:hypothetical protein F5141DRAFT_1003999 [Pisolithus sp. B1]|nr:hypothetical protein F5141DRAFT_1003999 [Pisolithus sp. B1]